MKDRIVEIWEEHSVIGAIILTICAVVGCLVACFGVMCLQAWLVMLLWNWIAVELFGAPVLGFWMAFGLRWLCSLLFKSKVTVNKKSED
jgi:phosphate/sulfate permease